MKNSLKKMNNLRRTHKFISSLLIFLLVAFISCGPTNYITLGTGRYPTMENTVKLENGILQIKNNIGASESLIFNNFTHAFELGDVGILNFEETITQSAQHRTYYLGYIYSELYLGHMEKIVAAVVCENGKIVLLNRR